MFLGGKPGRPAGISGGAHSAMEGVLSLNSRLGAVPGTALKRYGLFDSWKSLRSPYFVPGAVRIKEVQCARHHSAVTAFSGIDLPKGKPFCVSLRLRCPRPSQISPSKELFPFLVDKKRAVSKQKLSGIQPVQHAFDVPIPKAALLRSLFSSRFPCCCFLLLLFFFFPSFGTPYSTGLVYKPSLLLCP